MTDQLNKAELRRLAEAATGGDWEYRMGMVRTMPDQDGYVAVAVAPSVPKNWRGQRDLNMGYIAAANPAAILSLLDESEVLRKQVAALQSAENSWQTGYDKGREMGSKHRASEVDQLRAEVEALRTDAERYRWLRERVGVDFIFGDCNPWLPAEGVLMEQVDKDNTDVAIDQAMAKEGSANG